MNYGGRLEISGTAGRAASRISSWDTDHRQPAQESRTTAAPTSARSAASVRSPTPSLQNLGFWSGRTGGLSHDRLRPPRTAGRWTLMAPKTPVRPTTARSTEGSRSRPTCRACPGPAPVPRRSAATRRLRLSSPRRSTTPRSTDDVYGLFLANAVGASLHVTRQGQPHGRYRAAPLRLQRHVVDTSVSNSARTGSSSPGPPGPCDSENDQRQPANGVTGITGRPLANGPTATGTASDLLRQQRGPGQQSYADNGHYGMEIVAATTPPCATTPCRKPMGIVVARRRPRVIVDGNHLAAIRPARPSRCATGRPTPWCQATHVTGGTVGLYLRNASALVKATPSPGLTRHGISAIGTAGHDVRANTIAGRGPSAIDRSGPATSRPRTTTPTGGTTQAPCGSL